MDVDDHSNGNSNGENGNKNGDDCNGGDDESDDDEDYDDDEDAFNVNYGVVTAIRALAVKGTQHRTSAVREVVPKSRYCRDVV